MVMLQRVLKHIIRLQRVNTKTKMNTLKIRKKFKSYKGLPFKLRRKKPKYTPLSKRQDRPDAILWLCKNALN